MLTKCIPILLYGLEANCPMRKTDLNFMALYKLVFNFNFNFKFIAFCRKQIFYETVQNW